MYLDISYSFFTKREKLIFGPGNHEIGNTVKFWRDGEKRMPDSESATQNCTETTGFISVQKKKFHFVDLCYQSYYFCLLMALAKFKEIYFSY